MITEALINFATNIIQSMGYPGIFLLMTAESMFIPFPSEITMTFSGFLVSSGHFNFFLVVLSGGLGNVLGSSVAYYLGHSLKHKVINKIIEKYGKFLFVTKEEFTSTESLFKKHGSWIIVASRFIPGVRAIISVPAGAAHIPYPSFILYTALGSLAWSFILVYAGTILGSNWQVVRTLLHKFDTIILVVTPVLIAAYIWHKFRKNLSVQKT
ncbi:MAG: DedA family protein [Patescibacteria group bacterium]